MDLLIAQFNNGPLSLETIKTVLGTDQANWTVLSKKFKQDSNGNFFNERLATEVEKRKSFSNSRRENIKKRYEKSTLVDTYVDTSVLHMENRNRNTIPDDDLKEENAQKNQIQFEEMIVPEILAIWKKHNPSYVDVKEVDYPACLTIAYNIADLKKWRKSFVMDVKESDCLKSWEKIVVYIQQDPFWKSKTLDTIAQARSWQKIINDMVQRGPVKVQAPSNKVYSEDEKNKFIQFEQWIQKNAPRVSQMQEPFTIDQYFSTEFRKYKVEDQISLLKSMHNRRDLLEKNVSAYLTLLNWQSRESK